MKSQASQNRQMAKQFIRLAAISGAIFVLALLIVLSLLGWAYQDRIKSAFLEGLNKNLDTGMQVGELQLSLVRNFPMASLAFYGVRIDQAGTGAGSQALLEAKTIRLQFNLIDILKKDYTVKHVFVSEGSFRPAVLQDGEPNYIFWKTGQASGQDPFRFDLQRVLLQDMEIVFTHHDHDHHLELHTESLQMGGQFSPASTQLSARGRLQAGEIRLGGNKLPAGMPLEVDLAMQFSGNDYLYIRQGKLGFNGHLLSLQGGFSRLDSGMEVDVAITGQNLELGALLDDLSDFLPRDLKPHRASGRLGIEASISGPFSPTDYPWVTASFRLENGEIQHRPGEIHMKALTLSGQYTNGPQRNKAGSRLDIVQIDTRTEQGRFSGRFSIANFARPRISLKMIADLETADLVGLHATEAIAATGGRVRMDVVFEGQMSEPDRFTRNDLLAATLSGQLEFEQVLIRMTGNPHAYHGINGKMRFSDNHLVVEELTGMAGVSDFELSGFMSNVLPFLFIPAQQLHINASLRSDHIDLDQWLQHSVSEADTTYRLRFPAHLSMKLQADVGRINFRRFEAMNIRGTTSLNDRRFLAENLQFDTMEGEVQLEGVIDGSTPDRIAMACNARLHLVDIHQLFYQTGNFGQTGITDQNIHGRVTADLHFAAHWSPELEIDWSTMETMARLKVENGRLVNFSPLLALSGFLRVGDLSDVTFSTLENQIHIKNREVVIPDMEIRSSALNLQLSGRHSFENEIDYRLQVLLSDLLARNHRERRNPQEQYGEIIDDGLGRTTLFLKLSGTTHDPVFSYDYRGVREKLRDDLRSERRNLADILRREFSFLSRQQPDTLEQPLSEREQQMQRLKKQEQGRFVIEWEEF